MDRFYIKRGDTAPALRYSLLPATVGLSGASVVFNMRGARSIISRQSATIVSESPPVVEFGDWEPEHTEELGEFRCEFEVTYPDGRVETFPNRGFISAVVSEDLG